MREIIKFSPTTIPVIPILNHPQLDEIQYSHQDQAIYPQSGWKAPADVLLRNLVTDPSPEVILAELDILSQPDLTIMEIRTLT